MVGTRIVAVAVIAIGRTQVATIDWHDLVVAFASALGRRSQAELLRSFGTDIVVGMRAIVGRCIVGN